MALRALRLPRLKHPRVCLGLWLLCAPFLPRALLFTSESGDRDWSKKGGKKCTCGCKLSREHLTSAADRDMQPYAPECLPEDSSVEEDEEVEGKEGSETVVAPG